MYREYHNRRAPSSFLTPSSTTTTTTSTWRIQSKLVKPKTHGTAAHKTHTDPAEGAKAAAPAMTVARMASFMVNTS